MENAQNTDLLSVTEAEWKQFKKIYEQAVADKQDRFKFMGRDVLTAYAKYLIQYVDKKYGQN